MAENQRTSLESARQNFKAVFEASFPANPVELRKSPLYLAIQRRRKQVGHDIDISLEDIMSELWIRAEQQFDKGRSIENPGGWMYKVTYRIIADAVKERGIGRSRFVSGDLDEDILSALQSGQPSLVEQLGALEDRVVAVAKLQQALQQLKTDEQELLLFIVGNDKSYAQFAEYKHAQGQACKVPTNLRKDKERALGKLKKIFFTLQ
jgi:DNA-directed RNA polymerase specialized sigma24 family protein